MHHRTPNSNHWIQVCFWMRLVVGMMVFSVLFLLIVYWLHPVVTFRLCMPRAATMWQGTTGQSRFSIFMKKGSADLLTSDKSDTGMRTNKVRLPTQSLSGSSAVTAPTATTTTATRSSNRRARNQTAKRKSGFSFSSSSDQANGDLRGRVSVYCVGAKIDIPALRAHVFRRGFGGTGAATTRTHLLDDDDDAKLRELRLTRRPEDALLDDEVLHVSNAPLFVTTDAAGRTSSDFFHTGSDATPAASLPLSVSTMMEATVGEEALMSDESAEEADSISDKQSMAATLSEQAQEQLLMATQDIFYFEYGCVVFWGLSSREEHAALTELAQFTVDPVTADELDDSFDTMEYSFDHKVNPNRPIKFDLMKLRSLRVEEKLAFAYGLAQSSKLFVFESKVLQSVERTRYLPKELALRGKISCSKKDLNSLIGQLFVEQTEVNLFSSILDTPDFLWDDDEYLPTYHASRLYLEVDHRVSLLNSRLSVIRELLDVLNAQVADSNSTRLEWIVIWLITIEMGLGIATNPIFAGKSAIAAFAIPLALFFYKQFTS
jgi:uncharacterized Rmd1/YagE family protein